MGSVALVIAISLVSFANVCGNIEGTVTPALGNLTALLVSDTSFLMSRNIGREVFGNKLNGEIPREIGQLYNLVRLDLSNNDLVETVPTSLGNLKALKFLRLDNNALTGELPNKVFGLARWGHLKRVNVSSNYMSGIASPKKSRGRFTITSHHHNTRPKSLMMMLPSRPTTTSDAPFLMSNTTSLLVVLVLC